ncbi:MAG: hypothetical protein GF331_10675, partial [Chitinivibrionales bacterium]|nr:hypothetical protein [Chitinivibrionales bacterium]
MSCLTISVTLHDQTTRTGNSREVVCPHPKYLAFGGQGISLKGRVRMRTVKTLAALLCLALAGQAALLPMPSDIATSVMDFGATGDGVTDDSRAIQLAIDTNRTESKDYNGLPKTIYFPAGTYVISETLDWIGCAMTLQGQGVGATTIVLATGAQDFDDPATPKPMIRTPAGNMSFRQNIHDMTISIGNGNPGAVALDYISSNSGTVRDVELIAPDGDGVIGLDLTRAWPGPFLIKNVRVEGFDYGIKVKHSEYGPTFEGIALEGQNVAGFYNEGNVCAIRSLMSINAVPAIVNALGYGYVILLDGRFAGGDPSVSAITGQGLLYLRHVGCGGSTYKALAEIDGAAVVPEDTVDEYISGDIRSLWDSSPRKSLGLPVQNAPVYHDHDTTNWGRFVPRWYGDTGPLQDLLNSGKSTIYVKGGVYFNHTADTFAVPATVKRIIGFHSVFNRERGPAALVFKVEEQSAAPLVIEQFGYGVGVWHACGRSVAIKHGAYGYWPEPNAGRLFFEDVQSDKLTFSNGQEVWMRQLNTEGPELHVTNNGARLWILGVKTEGKGTVISTSGGGMTELLGKLLYPCQSFTSSDGPAFIVDNASASFMYRVSSYVNNGNYPVQVRETRGGEMREWVPSSNGAMICPLFVGYDSTVAG